jgi:NADPH:quinone reductase-like Zn-dependent oxidoreductase
MPIRTRPAELTALVEAGRLTVHVDRALPLDKAAKAYEIIAGGAVTGKLILVP